MKHKFYIKIIYNYQEEYKQNYYSNFSNKINTLCIIIYCMNIMKNILYVFTYFHISYIIYQPNI